MFFYKKPVVTFDLVFKIPKDHLDTLRYKALDINLTMFDIGNACLSDIGNPIKGPTSKQLVDYVITTVDITNHRVKISLSKGSIVSTLTFVQKEEIAYVK